MTIMEELLEQNWNKNIAKEAAEEAKKALNEAFGEALGYTITREQLNQLQHYANELFEIGTHCQDKWEEFTSSGTAEDCEKAGAFELLNEFYKKHYRLVNEIAGDCKIDGEIE